MQCPRWHNFGAKPLGRVEEMGTNFSSSQTLSHMGRIGYIYWIMNISTVDPLKVNFLHYTFPSRTSRPKIGPHHFTCEKVGPTKNHKLDRIEGLIAHESCRPQAVYKVDLSQCVLRTRAHGTFINLNVFFGEERPECV